MTPARLTGKVRIIAGQWRSRKISFPALPGLRPTHDRVRETLFNWLAPTIEAANCLDLFAGSGAFGFEALSRGAKQVTFVDSSKAVIEALKKNAELLKTDKAEIILADCPQQMPTLSFAPFDIVFLDPPFYQGLIEPTAKWLEQNNKLSETALIYIEVENGLSPLPVPTNWQIFRKKNTASLAYYLLQRQPS